MGKESKQDGGPGLRMWRLSVQTVVEGGLQDGGVAGKTRPLFSITIMPRFFIPLPFPLPAVYPIYYSGLPEHPPMPFVLVVWIFRARIHIVNQTLL